MLIIFDYGRVCTKTSHKQHPLDKMDYTSRNPHIKALLDNLYKVCEYSTS